MYTDKTPLKYVLSTLKINTTRERWANKLVDFNLNHHYKPGKTSIYADIFSWFLQGIYIYINKLTKEDKDKVSSGATNQLDNTEACLCSVNTINNLQKEEQHQKQGITP